MNKKRKFAFVGLLLALIMALTPLVSAYAEEGYEKAVNGVVRIFKTVDVTITNYDTNTKKTFQPAWIGSGFAIGEKGKPVDHFVTNRHCVTVTNKQISEWLANWIKENPEDAEFYIHDFSDNISITKGSPVIYVVFEDLDSKKEASRVIVSDKYDLACIVLPNTTDQRTALDIALYDDIKGESCWALGFPGISDTVISMDMSTSLPSYPKYCTQASGEVQILAENSTMGSCLQHTAGINGGNSGGPLVNKKGQVIGVNTWVIESANSANISQTTAQLKQFLDSENIKANYVEPTPNLLLLIAAAAVILIAIIVILLTSRRKPGDASHVKGNVKGEVRNLVVEKGTLGAGKSYTLIKGRPITIGTESSRCAVLFPKQTPGVSHIHCTVRFDGTTVKVKDENSTYGTYIDGSKLPTGGESVLHRGHTLSIGSQKEKFVLR